MHNIPTYIESIIVSLFSGTASEADAEQLRRWIGESSENKELWEQYRATNHLLKMYHRKNRYLPEKVWKKIRPLLEEEQSMLKMHRTEFIKWFCRIAAIIVIAFSAGMGVMYYSMKYSHFMTDASETQYSVPYGSKAKVVLPDNSTVWVNAGSILCYNTDFNRDVRSVYVEGEAYFQVAKNPEKPFYVKTSTVTLKVLGTSFNLKAYSDEANIETTVESGKVQLISNIEGQNWGDLILTAGQKVTVVRDLTKPITTQPGGTVGNNNILTAGTIKKTVITQDVDTELYTSWKDKRWLIEKESLGSLAVKLERRYNANISFSDERLKEYTFSGILENETLEQILEAIKLSAPINYKVNHNNVTLTPNKWIDKR